MNWRKPIFKAIMHLAGYRVGAYLRFLESIEYLSSEKIQEVQDKALCRLLLHAYENVPYYNEILPDAAVIKNGQVDLSGFANIPILTKDIIRQQGQRMYSRDRKGRKAHTNSSGGSTGQPVVLLQDRDYQAWSFAGRFLYNLWAGKSIGERELKLWGSERDILEGSEKLSTRLRRWIFNVQLLNTYRMSISDMREHIESWNRVKPKMVWAYTDSMFRLSQFVESEKLTVYAPEAIICTTSVLLLDVRKHIERTFKCKVFNQYGSREVGPISAECSVQDGMHIFAAHQKLEILDKHRQPVKGEDMGELIVTNLRNYSMPLIRYQIGDTAGFSDKQCSCGRGFPLLKEVTGRVFSHFVRKDGSFVHAQFFVGLLFFRPWIREFKIIQKEYDRIEVLVANEGKPDKNDIDDITDKIKQVMGQDCRVGFIFVEEVPPSPSGKYLYTISELQK